MPAEMLADMLVEVSSIARGSSGPQSEHSLTINVHVPTAGTKAGDKLPVIAAGVFVCGQWIFGGGFVVGSSELFPGDPIVAHSVAMGQPVTYAAMNYRLGPLGFLLVRGKEVKEAGVGNLGLQDPGAISSALHMVTNHRNTEGLFRAAIMSAGSPLPTGDIEELQCGGTSDTLVCLRQVSGPADNLTAAAAALPNLFSYSGLRDTLGSSRGRPIPDRALQHLMCRSSTGGALDEGTIFATGSWNLTTEQEFHDYVHKYLFSSTPEALLEPLFSLYPADPAVGSPFMTGDDNQLAPMYKRMAAFQGDITGNSPGLGYAHGRDILPAFMGVALADYIIQFVATLDPNGDGANGTTSAIYYWPKYDTKQWRVLETHDDGVAIGADTLCIEPMAALTAISLAYPMSLNVAGLVRDRMIYLMSWRGQNCQGRCFSET
ncbi:hypothetical protein GSI_10116 [Ganoderma sinense ZZ0214-1]|uniref:Carboxylesterase type B domain-containing protein n=1 Tax=Ganoderma sinense ZZ0214-1 TaxID=1077348 RepID=A0A2G8S097_9APHY|nr:hypothetical protein GSI_10116 [Ganoderma sinense ZZ0214-1]